MSALAHWLDPSLIESLNQLTLGTRRVAQGLTTGTHRSPLKGSSLEFRQHRAYTPGDEPRRIDWRVLARSDRIFVKEYDAETNLRAMLVLDASGSMAYGLPQSKFNYAGRLMAALAYLMLARSERVGLAVASQSSPVYIPPASSATQLSRVADVLSQTAPAAANSLETALDQTTDRIGKRSLVVVLSDFFVPIDRLQLPLSRLAFARHEVVLLRVLHPNEVTFPFNRWTTFQGLENEPSMTLDLSATRHRYLAQFAAHEKALRSICLRLQANLLTLQTDRPLMESIRAVIHRRSA